MQTDYRFRNHCSAIYRLLVSTLAPCGIRRRDPPTSCILRWPLRFPCGTLAATMSQVDNCIVCTERTALLLMFIHYCFQDKNLNYTRLTVEKTWLCSDTIPPFEWTRYVRLLAFSCQGYSLYYLLYPTISNTAATQHPTLACRIGLKNSSHTL